MEQPMLEQDNVPPPIEPPLSPEFTRREFLRMAGVLAGGLAISSCAPAVVDALAQATRAPDASPTTAPSVTPSVAPSRTPIPTLALEAGGKSFQVTLDIQAKAGMITDTTFSDVATQAPETIASFFTSLKDKDIKFLSAKKPDGAQAAYIINPEKKTLETVNMFTYDQPIQKLAWDVKVDKLKGGDDTGWYWWYYPELPGGRFLSADSVTYKDWGRHQVWERRARNWPKESPISQAVDWAQKVKIVDPGNTTVTDFGNTYSFRDYFSFLITNTGKAVDSEHPSLTSGVGAPDVLMAGDLVNFLQLIQEIRVTSDRPSFINWTERGRGIIHLNFDDPEKAGWTAREKNDINFLNLLSLTIGTVNNLLFAKNPCGSDPISAATYGKNRLYGFAAATRDIGGADIFNPRITAQYENFLTKYQAGVNLYCKTQ